MPEGSALAGEVTRRVCLGELGRGAQLLGQAKVAAPSAEVRAELQGLLKMLAQARPQPAPDFSAEEEVSARHLGLVLRKAPRGSGPDENTHWCSKEVKDKIR